MFIFLDIETLRQPPYPFLVRSPDEFRAPRNYKLPGTIAKWQAEQAAGHVAELTERSSLQAHIGGIIACVAIWTGPEGRSPEPLVLENKTSDEAGERAVLSSLASAVKKAAAKHIVTWNGHGLDYPFVAARAMRHGLWALAGAMYQAKPWDTKLLDLRLVWTRGDKRGPGRLDEVARFLGMDAALSPLTGDEDVLPGKLTTEAWFRGEEGRRQVLEHCRADVKRVAYVFQRLRAAGMLEGVEAVVPTMGNPAGVEPRNLDADRQELERLLSLGALGLSREQVDAAIAGIEPTLAGEVVATVRDRFARQWVARADVVAHGKAYKPGVLLDLDRDYLVELRGLQAGDTGGDAAAVTP